MKKVTAFFVAISLSLGAIPAQAAYTPPAPAQTEPAAPAQTQAPAPVQTESPAPSTIQSPVPVTAPISQAPTVELRSAEVELARISKMVYQKDFRKARSDLRALDREFPNNADINNLLGFTSRKLKMNRSAASYYSKALRLDPGHLDALSYQGELFITTKKLPSARKNLAQLKRLCGVNCSQYQDLKKALDKKK